MVMAEAGDLAAQGDGAELWDDWCPLEQTALDFLRAAAQKGGKPTAEAEGEGSEDEYTDEDSDDDWNPVAQQAAGGDEEDDDDDDWAPAQQGAADTKASEEEALKKLLEPPKRPEADTSPYDGKKEADAAGRLLYEMKRPPTVEEAKAEIPRGPGVDVDQLPEPEYREMRQEEAITLVRRGASVNYQGQHGRSPLHKACESAYPVLVKAICDAGGDMEIRDQYGETPLLWLAHAGGGPVEGQDAGALRVRRSETIEAMLSCGADVHAVNPRGRTVLHLASMENDQRAIETFIEGMADVNAQDIAGFTALMWAAGRDGSETVKMLLDYDADMNLSAARGQTAMTFALTNGCGAIVDILERHKMILDAEEAQRIKERGERDADVPDEEPTDALQLPKPDWACKTEKPAKVEPFAGRRVYMQAKPDRHSNVYVGGSD